jgi:hypothetical protein
MDHRTYHQEKKSIRQTHLPLSSISNMGRSGTQIVYYGNWKRLLLDKGCHKENSINIEKLQQGHRNSQHEDSKKYWTSLYVYRSNTRIHLALSPTWIEENQVIFEDFFCDAGLQIFFVMIL